MSTHQQLRYVRLKLAFMLEGPGARKRFAEKQGVTSQWISICLSGYVDPALGKARHSDRLELAADIYTEQVFAKHAKVLDLDATAEG